jgi:hypothetical protein
MRESSRFLLKFLNKKVQNKTKSIPIKLHLMPREFCVNYLEIKELRDYNLNLLLSPRNNGKLNSDLGVCAAKMQFENFPQVFATYSWSLPVRNNNRGHRHHSEVKFF